MGLKFGYLTGALLLGAVYLLMYLWRRDLRREMVFGGLLAAPYALTAPFFIPEYWDPPYLLSFGRIGLGVEDFLFCFFVGGVAAVIYEVIWRKKPVKIAGHKRVSWWPYGVGTGVFLLLEYFRPLWSIGSLAASLVLVAGLVVWVRRDLLTQVVSAGGMFAVLYLGMFRLFLSMYPGYVEQVYRRQLGWEYGLAGVPVEEVLFAVGIGMAWSVGYEYILGYRTRRS